FFQAADGIRDFHVTGVQTCALPIFVEMNTPGITIQGIPNMAYRRDFNQVFFEDVRVPAGNLLGGENRGWYVAATTLDFERSNIRSEERRGGKDRSYLGMAQHAT